MSSILAVSCSVSYGGRSARELILTIESTRKNCKIQCAKFSASILKGIT